MRSRYCAHFEGALDYLIRTHHPETRAPDQAEQLRKSLAGTEWIALTVLRVEQGQACDSEGFVEFVAAFRRLPSATVPFAVAQSGRIEQMHERSRFVRHLGAWSYIDGVQLGFHQPRRNDPCWCGSGKKTKHCHP